MIKSEYKLGKVWGIPIKIHVSLLILLAYLVLQAINEGSTPLARILSVIFTLVLAILLFGSIALHELGHSFVAIRKGCRVYEITLMFMGGAAKMDRMPQKPLDEFLMAVAGPAVSLFIGLICYLASRPLLHFGSEGNLIAAFAGDLTRTIGFINIILAVFNLIPAFPMDGGRILRALLSTRLSRLKATYIASRTGRVIAVLFFIIGIFGLNISVAGYRFFQPHNPVLIIIAFFVFTIADREYRMVQIEELLKLRRQQTTSDNNAPPFGYTSPDNNSVIISPPPYADDPPTRTPLHEEPPSRNPFSRFFGH